MIIIIIAYECTPGVSYAAACTLLYSPRLCVKKNAVIPARFTERTGGEIQTPKDGGYALYCVSRGDITQYNAGVPLPQLNK